VDAASAKPFKTLIKIQNGDPDLEMWVKDIDLTGDHLHLFAHKFFNNSLIDGQCHFLVDHPSTVVLPNLAAQKAAGLRPFFKMIRSDQLIAAYSQYVGGDTQVVHCRIQTQRIERTPDYKEITWNQILVVEVEPGTTNGVVQLWEQEAGKGGNDWALMSEEQVQLLEVPLVTGYSGDKEGDFVSRSIFQDLAYKQIEHWQSSSAQRDILSAARFPMLAASGVQLEEDDEEGVQIGPWKVLYSPEAAGRWYYVEPKGSAIESGLKDLEMLEFHMDVMALNPVTATHRQYVPQNERDIQETRVHSVIHDAALSTKDALERGIRFMGNWTNRDYSQVQVGLNVDFGNTKDKLAELALLLNAWKERGITRETFLKEARVRDLFGDDFDIAAELTALEALDAQIAEAEAAGGQPGQKPAQKPGVKPSAEKVDFPNGQERPLKQI